MVAALKVAVGNDHAAIELKLVVAEHLGSLGVEVLNLGVDTTDAVDYPDVAARVARTVAGGEADLGVLVCGTGIGMAMAAGKIDGVRAALCCYEYHARMAREHNHANICCLGARVTGSELAKAIVAAFIATAPSDDPRHARRVDKIQALQATQ